MTTWGELARRASPAGRIEITDINGSIVAALMGERVFVLTESLKQTRDFYVRLKGEIMFGVLVGSHDQMHRLTLKGGGFIEVLGIDAQIAGNLRGIRARFHVWRS